MASDEINKVMDNIYSQLYVAPVRTGWIIVYPDGDPFDSQVYSRAQDARRAITMMRKPI